MEAKLAEQTNDLHVRRTFGDDQCSRDFTIAAPTRQQGRYLSLPPREVDGRTCLARARELRLDAQRFADGLLERQGRAFIPGERPLGRTQASLRAFNFRIGTVHRGRHDALAVVLDGERRTDGLE